MREQSEIEKVLEQELYGAHIRVMYFVDGKWQQVMFSKEKYDMIADAVFLPLDPVIQARLKELKTGGVSATIVCQDKQYPEGIFEGEKNWYSEEEMK